MARTSLLIILAVSMVAAWVGHQAEAVPATLLALMVGVIGVLAVDGAQRRKLRELSRQVNGWMGKLEVEQVSIRGGHEAQHFVSTINALGAAYARRGQRVHAAEPRLGELVLALPEAAILFDAELSLLAINDRAAEIFGGIEPPASATQALGSGALAELVRLTVTEPQEHRLEARIGDRVIEAATVPLAGKVLFLARDRTQDVLVESMRRDFVANASHELKTPVAGIRSLSEALDILIEKDPGRAHELNTRIRSEAVRLDALVSDLMSLRRVDERIAGEALVTLDVHEQVAQVLGEMRALAQERQVELHLTDWDDDPVLVQVVLQDLRLVLRNLVDNAVKYNRPGGEVEVSVAHVGHEVVIEVRDTGIGIPGKDLGRIFERFQRVDEGRSRAAGGTGLGLSIVRHAVERNGGHVSVTSLLGKGTTFQVNLPAVAQ